MLERLGKLVSGTIGRESLPIKLLRPAYERLLDITSGGKGSKHRVNDLDDFWVNPRYRSIYPSTYEPEVYRFLRDNVRQGSVCMNVGAHVGTYAAALATWSGKNGRVFAFEPNPDTSTLLKDYLNRNRLSERVTVVNSAVGEGPGETSFIAAGVEGFSRIGQPHPEQENVPSKEITVPVTTIDSYCEANLVEPDWIVMDIEGFEVAALRGASRTISSRGPALRMVVEMHPTLWELAGETAESFRSTLVDLNLEVLPLTGQDDPFAVNGVVQLKYLGNA